MNDILHQPLDDQELDELGALLAERAGDDGLYLDGAHGFFTALALSPEEISAAGWLPVVLDQDQPFDSEQQAHRAVALLLRLAESVHEDLDQFTYEPILGEMQSESGDMVFTARGWCDGFSRGIDLSSDRWVERMNQDARLTEMMSPIIALAADEGLFESDDGEEPPPLSENEYEDALNKLPNAVYSVHQYWREHGDDFVPGSTPAAAHAPRWRGGRSVH